jgi:hypothetical protein
MNELFDITLFHFVASSASIIKQQRQTTMCNHVLNIWFVVKNLPLISHTQSAAKEDKHVKQSIALKYILQSMKHRNWKHSLTGDES